MKPVTVDMLRAHLMVASLTAMGAEMLVLLSLPVLPVSQQTFASTPFRWLALAVILGGVAAMRVCAQVAFHVAVRQSGAAPAARAAGTVAVAADCPRRWLVVLHLRMTGRAFKLS